ncbi:cupin domain-containing protein [Micromonospora sp. NPDC050495]|uniref:cupin domain-containing protein n=1 Tax=Micromonospora sp. NPDC050495 TaxID=3154936 RepID=UPI0033F9115A
MAEPATPVRLNEKFAQFDEHWSPKIVAEANGWHIKLVKVLGEFVWHSHADVDEVFWVIDGTLTIRLQDRPEVQLAAGDVFVVPRGLPHQPVAEQECRIALLEPAGVVNTGGSGGELTAKDSWL